MEISTLPLGPLQANCYIVADPEAKVCAAIDPGDDGQQVATALENLGLSLKAILLTHGHFDHVGGVQALQEATGAPVYLHSSDLSLPQQLSGALPAEFVDLSVEHTLTVGSITFTVLETPGHSTGSVCLLATQPGQEPALFTGDTLFQGSCGRTDFPGGSLETILASLRTLAGLEGDYRVFPGHGGETTLDQERRYNAYMREAVRS